MSDEEVVDWPFGRERELEAAREIAASRERVDRMYADEVTEVVADIARHTLAAKSDRLRRIWEDTWARKDATLAHAEHVAVERMREQDAQYDEPIDLTKIWESEPLRPTVCAMTNGACVLYEGYRNGVFGPSESGKTMLAVMGMIQEIKAGRPVVYLDFENSPVGFVDRLRSFGATRDEVAEYVRYFYVTGALPSPAKAAEMAGVLHEEVGRLVVIDTVHAGMTELSLDPWRADHVEQFYRLSMDPWAEAGCTPVVLDHTAKKDPFTPYGSERKRSGISGMLVNVVTAQWFDQRTAGFSNLYIQKDRHGGGPEYVDETRLFGELHIIPIGAGPGATSHGVIEMRPLDRAAVAAREAEAEAATEAARRMAEDALRRSVREWVKKYDDGDGLFESWITKGESGRGIPRVAGSTHELRRVAKEMLDDPMDPLVRTDDGKRIRVDEMLPEADGGDAE